MANILSAIYPNVPPGRKRTAGPYSGANIKNPVIVVRIDDDPKATGLDLPIGTLATWDDNGVGKFYAKTGPAVTDWTLSITEPQRVHENLYFIGSGTGASKTTTVIDGNIIAEQMGIGDELFVLWHFPMDIDKSAPLNIEVEWYLNANEPGKVISGEISFTLVDGGVVNVVTDVINLVNDPVPSPAYFPKQSLFPVNLQDYSESAEAESLHIKFKRIASSNDPIAHPRLHHISVEWTPLTLLAI